MRQDLYVIEARKPDGALDLSGSQPETAFGLKAITGITWRQMANVIERKIPGSDLFAGFDSSTVPSWPSMIDPRFKARRKTW